MTTIGLVGAGQMGAALGGVLARRGHRVVTTLSGRSDQTARRVQAAGFDQLPDLAAVLEAARVVLVVVPPGAAVLAARQIVRAAARTRARPLVADLNAVSPFTVEQIMSTLAAAGLDLVDGSISGGPPTAEPGPRIYLSGPRAAEVAGLRWHPARPVLVGSGVGTASAVKMCTASIYKGVTGLLVQALWTADHHGVAEHVLADLAEGGYDPARRVAVAAAKAWRFVPEMREIAQTQRLAGLPAGLFEAMATVYELLAQTPLAADDPETAADRGLAGAEVVARLIRAGGGLAAGGSGAGHD